MPARADEVRLTYGDRITGHIVAVTRTVVQLESPGVGLIEVQRRYVEQLSTDDTRVVSLHSGERLSGQIVGGPGNRT